jgi:hypothetical protein
VGVFRLVETKSSNQQFVSNFGVFFNLLSSQGEVATGIRRIWDEQPPVPTRETFPLLSYLLTPKLAPETDGLEPFQQFGSSLKGRIIDTDNGCTTTLEDSNSQVRGHGNSDTL